MGIQKIYRTMLQVLGQYDLDFCEKYISHVLLPARRTLVPISLRVGGRYTKQFIAYFPTDISFDKLPDGLTKEGSKVVVSLGSEEVNEKTLSVFKNRVLQAYLLYAND